MARKDQIWYSFLGKRPEENQIGFYNTNKFAWVKTIESSASEIKEEIIRYVDEDSKRMIPYFNKDLVSKTSVWKTSAFRFWNWNFKKNQKSCPKTMQVLEQIPNLISASVSILEPNSEIHPHRGDTNAIMRGHLPILVPEEKTSLGFKVGDDQVVWEEGKLLLFNDAAYHNAWNLSSSQRIVLIIDVIRPEFVSRKYNICSNVLGSLIFQNLALKFNLICKFQQWQKNTFIKLISTVLNPILRVQNI